MKNLIIGAIIVALLAGAGFYVYKAGYLNKYLNKVSIMDTPTVVKNIKSIQELSTACFYEEIIQSEPIKKKDSLIIIANGKVRAGFDLKELGEENITIEHDTTLSIVLPDVKIFTFAINPNDVKFIEGQKAKNEKVFNRAIAKAQKRIEEDAIKDGILDKARESGKKQLTELFKAFGFKEVYVDIE